MWWAVLAFWIFLGFVIANQIFWGMRDHHHSWWRLFLWQAGSCAIWTPFVPLVFALARRFPLYRRLPSFAVHAAAAVVVAAVHLVPVTVLTILLDPYRPVSEATSFVDEYEFMMLHWFGQDVLIYAGLLAVGAVIDFRERQKNRRIRESMLQAELARAQLRALRLELQPHFIFNAMNAVVGLLRNGDPGRAEKMLIGLSELLRRTLDGRERPLVPLAEELRVVRLYLDVEQIRFSDRLEIVFETEPGTERALVPNLLLQPLAENAVRHGVTRRVGARRIVISARRRRQRLLLRVIDDGPGLGTPSDGHGVGLENVSSRLEAIYGQDWSLDLRAAPDGGTEVSVEIPWQEVDEEAAAAESISKGTREELDPAPVGEVP